MNDLDLRPLADGESPLGTLFRTARAQQGEDAAVARLAERLAPQLQAPSPGAGAPATSNVGLRVLAASGVAIVAVATLWSSAGTAPSAKLIAAKTALVVPVVAASAPSPVSSTAPAPQAVPAKPPSPPQPAASVALKGPSELALLSAARRALSTNPEQSLALTETHRVRFPGSPLAQERDVIRLDALARLGRKAEAANAATQFRSQYKGSAHQRHVDEKAQ